MSSKYQKSKVIQNIELSKGIYKMTIDGDYSADRAGQFYMLRSWGIEPFLSRPISIHDANSEGITFLYEVVGEGTRLFSELKKGDFMELLGPLGNGFDIENISGKVAIVTGGIGIAPMGLVVKQLKNCEIDLYAGFRDKEYCLDYMGNHAKQIHISTDSGAKGHKGFIIDIFDPTGYDYVLSCGPTPLMKKVAAICNEKGVKSLLSLESRMACGVGACLGCTCETTGGKKRVCKEGPVFSGEEVLTDA